MKPLDSEQTLNVILGFSTNIKFENILGFTKD